MSLDLPSSSFFFHNQEVDRVKILLNSNDVTHCLCVLCEILNEFVEIIGWRIFLLVKAVDRITDLV